MGGMDLNGSTGLLARSLPILRGVEMSLSDQRFALLSDVNLAHEASSCVGIDARPEGRKL